MADKLNYSSSVAAVLKQHKVAACARFAYNLAESADPISTLDRPQKPYEHSSIVKAIRKTALLADRIQMEMLPESRKVAEAAKLFRESQSPVLLLANVLAVPLRSAWCC